MLNKVKKTDSSILPSLDWRYIFFTFYDKVETLYEKSEGLPACWIYVSVLSPSK